MSRDTPKFYPLLSGDDLPPVLIDGLVTSVGPPQFAKVHKPDFIRLAMGSLSISFCEKIRILDALPRLGQFQVDELITIFTEERQELARLCHKEYEYQVELNARSILGVFCLAVYRGTGYPKKCDEADAIRKMVAMKFDTPDRRAWLHRALAVSGGAALQFVFGNRPPLLGTVVEDIASFRF
ncbi:MAG: hypothetical protein RBS05_15565 [Zoogloea oleivorans]|jgi:hypothetical protein|uniref:hypothetical protein n=1 Tax=Zoogloea oleivorans TaxID=1552750 RepID=UPI002A360F66|nr:hypothetical protein [Zoogloea oleivorans]MDY0037327.1 hypothetical protein [Zoogloea oleivorans]